MPLRIETLILMGLLAAASSGCSDELKLDPAPGKILMHPFRESEGMLASANAWEPQGMADLAAASERLLMARGLDARVLLREQSADGQHPGVREGIESASYGFELDGFPLCDYQVKMHRFADGSAFVLGSWPQTGMLEDFKVGPWPERARAEQAIARLMARDGSALEVQSATRCLLLTELGLRTVWDIRSEAGGLLYRSIADGARVYAHTPLRFDAHEGYARAHDSNSEGAPLKSYPLFGLSEQGFLSNPFFETCVAGLDGEAICPLGGGRSDWPFAVRADGRFDYDPRAQRSEFIQASLFAHANEAMEWLLAQGYRGFDGTPIRLLAHATFGQGEQNNAFYQPSHPPVILVGDGDDRLLKNLGTDADVVSHELAHHVIFETVTSMRGESLVLHEGIADFLTYSRTGNACLAETVCTASPEGEQLCALPGRCLRSGDNDLTLDGPDLPEEPHLRSQLLSGLLWDLYKKDGMPLTAVNQIVFKALHLLVADSGYLHLAISLLAADKILNEGAYCETIRARLASRGFAALTGELSCRALPPLPESTLPLSGARGGKSDAKSKKNAFERAAGCGVLAGQTKALRAARGVLLWGLPLLLVCAHPLRRLRQKRPKS